MFNLVKDDYDENMDDIMKSVSKLLGDYGFELEDDKEKEELKKD